MCSRKERVWGKNVCDWEDAETADEGQPGTSNDGEDDQTTCFDCGARYVYDDNRYILKRVC